ncbi:histidinol-phosphate transaminase [soil metagenome]
MVIDFKALANSSIHNLQPYQPGKPIDELQRELGINQVIKLASNENPLGPSKYAIEAAQKTLEQVYLYPDGSGYELKQALAKGFNLSAAQITLGNGSDNVLSLIAQTFVKPGQDILISQYAYSTFAIIASAINANAVFAPAKNWAHDLSAIAKNITAKTQLIFLANPNNPTGTWFSEAELVSLLEAIPSHILVVSDEAYNEYIDEPDYPDTLKLQQKYPNLIITHTFSKIYALAGLRVGYAISHPDIADMINRIRLPFNVSSPALAAASAAFQDQQHCKKSIEMNMRGKAQLSAAFTRMNLEYIPSMCNFVTVDVRRDANKIYQALLREGVIVRPLTPYNMPTHLRISIGLAEENEIFIQALAKVLS